VSKKLEVVQHQSSCHRQQGPPRLLASSPRLTTFTKPTREQPIIISSSELKSFLRCRTQWAWRYQDQLTSIERKPALALGTVVHEVLDQFYSLPVKRRTTKLMERLATLVIPKMMQDEPLADEDRELAYAMLVGYAAWARDEDAEIGLETCFPEEEFLLPLTASGLVCVRGKIDNRFVSTTRKKTMAMLESKTAGQFKTNIVETNLQLSVYLWALRAKFPGYRAYTAYYQQLRKQLPGPRVKADLFMREPVERSDEEIAQWALDTERAALDMLDAAIYPSPQDTCSWSCDYQMACLMRGEPDDLRDTLKSQYSVKPPYHERVTRNYKVKV
jgi:hypothetical protein